MRRTKGWFALTLAILLAALPVLAEESAKAVDLQTPKAEVVEVPLEQTETPVEEPMEETPAEEAPVEDPVQEIPVEETAGDPPVEEPATEMPAGEPVEETPAEEPAEEAPVEEPVTEMPVEEPAAEVPVEEPAPEPDLAFAIADPQGVAISNNYCAIELSQQLASVTLTWTCRVACDGYQVIVTYPDGSQPVNQFQTEAACALPLVGLVAGRYTVTVIACLGDVPVAQADLAIDFTQSQPMPEGGMPGGFSGGSGGFKRGGSMLSGAGQQTEADQGFRVTAGKALTSSHNSGDKSMTPNGAVTLDLDDAPMTALVLGDNELEIALADGSAFTAAHEGDVLTLIPELPGTWVVNGYALKTLNRSGISTLVLGGAALPTEPVLTGDAYARLCAAGFVSADYTYLVNDGGVTVRVNGAAYRLDESGELIEMEG